MSQIFTYKTMTDLRAFAGRQKVTYSTRKDEPQLLEDLASLGIEAMSNTDYFNHYGAEAPTFNLGEWKREQKALAKDGADTSKVVDEPEAEEPEAEEPEAEEPEAEEPEAEEPEAEVPKDSKEANRKFEPEVTESPMSAEQCILRKIRDLTDQLATCRVAYAEAHAAAMVANEPRPLHELIAEQRAQNRAPEVLAAATRRQEMRSEMARTLKRRERLQQQNQ